MGVPGLGRGLPVFWWRGIGVQWQIDWAGWFEDFFLEFLLGAGNGLNLGGGGRERPI